MSEEHKALVGKLLSGMRWSVTLRFGAQMISWLITLVVVRYISPEHYGLNAMLEAPLEILMLFSTLGIDMALVRAKEIKPHELKSSFGLLLLVNGLLFSVYFFGGEYLAGFYNEPRLAPIAHTLAWVFLIAPFRVIPNAMMDRALDFKLKAAVDLIATVVAAICTLVMAFYGAGVWALVYGIIISSALRALMLTLARPWFTWPSFDFTHAYLLARYGGLVSLNTLVVLLSDKILVLVGGPHLGTEAMGFLAVGMQFAFLPMAKIMPILQQVMFPAFARLQEHPDQVSWYFKRAVGLIAIVMFPMLIGLACVAREFVLVVFGERWLSVVPLMSLLALAMPIRLIANLYEPLLNAVGRPGLVLIATVVRLLLLLAGSLVAVSWGVVGLGMAWTGAVMITTAMIISMARDALGVRFSDLARELYPALLGSITMAGSVFAVRAILHLPSWGQLSAEIVGGGVVYLATLRIFYPKPLADLFRLALKRA